MKIHDNNIVPAERSDVSERHQIGDSASTGAPDQIQLSGLSRQLRLLASDSPERKSHLDQLSAEIASGRYHADPDQIVCGIIEDALLGAAK